MWFIPLTSVSRISILTINKIEQNVKGLLFNSLRELQTKPLPPIRHICDFSRGALNVRSMRSHPTLAPRPQICLIGGNGFCAMAGEDELNRGEAIWGQKLMSSTYSRMTGNRGDDLAFLMVISAIFQ